MKKAVFLLGAILFLAGCNSKPKVDIQAEKDALQHLEDQWTLALQKRDAKTIMGYYANHAVIMVSNKPILKGIDEIRIANDSIFADSTLLFQTYTGKIDAIEVAACGDLAYTWGSQEMSIKTEKGLVTDRGKWVDIWKKTDGQWKVVVSAGSSNNPLEVK